MARFEVQYRICNTLLLVGLLVLTGLLASATVTSDGLQPFFSSRPLPTLCVIRAKTGLECSTCGLTRSCVLLLQGEYRQSLDYHPYGRLIVAFMLLQLLLRAGLLLRGRLFGGHVLLRFPSGGGCSWLRAPTRRRPRAYGREGEAF